MEVVIEKQYPVSAGIPAAWAVLSDMHALASCMPGAQITEDIDATHFMGSVRVKVGPAVAAFAGTIEILALLSRSVHSRRQICTHDFRHCCWMTEFMPAIGVPLDRC